MKMAGVVMGSCLLKGPRGADGVVVGGILVPLLGVGLTGVSVSPRDSCATAEPHFLGFEAAREAQDRGAVEAGWARGAVAAGGVGATDVVVGTGVGAGVRAGDFSATATGTDLSGSGTTVWPLG